MPGFFGTNGLSSVFGQPQSSVFGQPQSGSPPPAYNPNDPASVAAQTKQNIALDANGNPLPGLTGQYSGAQDLQVQNRLAPNLSDAQAIAKQQADFGLGGNNSAQTNAAIDAANATGAKYGGAFDTLASGAGAASAAAAARGTAMYGGDTSAYGAAQANAGQDRGLQTGAYGQLMNFAQQGPGPSAAQAQLQQATNANQQSALALARSGRGMGGSDAAMRGAIAQNAVTQQNAAGQTAELRANENTAFQSQRLQALGQAGGVAGQVVSGDQGTASSGLAGAQYQTNTALGGTQLNDTTALNYGNQQQAALGAGLGANVGAQTQDLNLNASALAGRESEYSFMNANNATQQGIASTTNIADANRQAAYTGAALSAIGTGASLVSDERAKTDIQPLGSSTVQPLASQATGGAPALPSGPSRSDEDAAKSSAMGGAVGGAAGSAIGGAVGTAIAPGAGTVVGGVLGHLGGALLGKAISSDVRAKTDVVPLSKVFGGALTNAGAALQGRPASANQYSAWGPPQDDPEMVRNPNNPSQYISAYAPISAASNQAHGPTQRPSSASMEARYGLSGPPRQLDTSDPFEQLQKLSPSTPVATSSAAVDKYASAPAPKADKVAQRFARDDSHPILSQGDALLADTARATPGSIYQYKDPTDGAGTYVGPMAQDLAANPLTRSTVVEQPDGKLGVDTGRLTTVNTATNHAQQNQIDALDAKMKELRGLLQGSSAYPETQEGDTGADQITSDERAKVKIVPTKDWQPPRTSPYQPISDASRYAGRVTFRPTGSDPYPYGGAR